MENNSNYSGWGDKALYSVELTPLYWHYQGKRYPEDGGVEYYEQNGEIYQRDDVCLDCAFEGTTECVTDDGLLCNEFDSKYYHIFKLIDNGTK